MKTDECLTRARFLREDWYDEIPERVIHSPTKYKCRKGWFHMIYNIVDLGNILNLVDDKTNESLEEFKGYLDRTKFRERRTCE